MADPAWPALVAAVTTATTGSTPGEHAGWQPQQLLAPSYDLLRGGQPDDEPLRPGELATALVWRIAMLTDPSSAPTPTLAPVSEPPPDDDQGPALPAERVDVDEDWLTSLMHDDAELDAAPPDDAPPTAPDDALRTAPGFGVGTSPRGVPALDAWQRAEQQRREAEQDQARFWASATVPRQRLIDLNTMAEDFFTRHYADTWAADYLRDRLGTDLVDDPRVSVGYAPNNWTALTTHLRRHGATDTEILGAGLGVPARTGTVVDRFRDRLVFPIKAANPDDPDRVDTLGFIARRNPTKTDDDTAGPKYLNTADTDLFTKGQALYGLADNAAALAAGATPVLVEGPIDALADTQADALRPYLSTRQRADSEPERAPIVVATDNDRAGHQAAHRAFWRLAGCGEDPRHLLLPPGTDPAELLHNDGPAVLRANLDAATPLAEKVIADRTAVFADRPDTIEGRVHAARRAADVIGALPATTWLDRAHATADQFGVAHHTVLNEVLDRGHDWTEDPRGLARQRVAERLPNRPGRRPHRAATRHNGGLRSPPRSAPAWSATRTGRCWPSTSPAPRPPATTSRTDSPC